MALNERIAYESLSLLLWYERPDMFFEFVTGYRPAEHQKELLDLVKDLNNTHILVSAGRSTGKTLTLSVIALWSVTVLPRVRNDIDEYSVSIIAGSLNQAKLLYKYIVDWVSKNPYLKEQVIGEPLSQRTDFKTGYILTLPSSLKSILGHHENMVIIDEAVECEDEIIQRAFSIPSGKKYPRMILSSTPHNNERSVLFREILMNPDKYGFRVAKNWRASQCHWISAEQILKAKMILPEDVYKIDYEGEPVDEANLMFKLTDLRECIVNTKPTMNPELDTVMGIDWGFVDETVITIAQWYKNVLVILHQEGHKGKKFTELQERILELYDKWNVSYVYADSSHIGENQRLLDAEIPVKKVVFSKKKEILKQRLRSLVEKHQILIWQGFQNLIQQMRRYTFDTHKNDDYVDSLLCVMDSYPKKSSRESIVIANNLRDELGHGIDWIDKGKHKRTSKDYSDYFIFVG